MVASMSFGQIGTAAPICTWIQVHCAEWSFCQIGGEMMVSSCSLSPIRSRSTVLLRTFHQGSQLLLSLGQWAFALHCFHRGFRQHWQVNNGDAKCCVLYHILLYCIEGSQLRKRGLSTVARNSLSTSFAAVSYHLYYQLSWLTTRERSA